MLDKLTGTYVCYLTIHHHYSIKQHQGHGDALSFTSQDSALLYLAINADTTSEDTHDVLGWRRGFFLYQSLDSPHHAGQISTVSTATV